METPISHISDTALWIAGYRAQEAARPDALFNDDLAKKLAGERGAEMVRITPNTHLMAFAMAMRTTGIDRLVGHAIALGVDTVINLGAGLDTRPYRMKLPPGLNWIDVDFPSLIDYKDQQLAGDTAVCKLTRIGADLSSADERQKLFARLGSETNKAVVITEGVIGYLDRDEVEALAWDLMHIPSFQYWIMDFSQGRFRRGRHSAGLKDILKNTPVRFGVADPITFFRRLGWVVNKVIYILDEADRHGRRLPVMFPWSILMKLFPGPLRRMANKTYGYVMFEQDSGNIGGEKIYEVLKFS